MNILYLLIILIIFVKLILVASIRPIHSRFSFFELERRAKEGDVGANENLKREKSINDVIALQKTSISILIISLSILLIAFYGWIIGIVAAILVGLVYEPISKLSFLKKISKRFYLYNEKSILKFIYKNPRLIKFISGVPASDGMVLKKIESREELSFLIDSSDHILDDNEKRHVISSISFNNLRIKDVMTLRNKIICINKDEFLGPLNLNDLHKNGHNFLPVLGSGIDDIIGILDLNKLLNLDIKKSMIAEKAMDNKVFYVNEDQDLYQGLVAFSRTHQHLLIVINENQKTVGVVTQKDIVEALIGRKITGNFDDYDNLRVVAQRK